MNNHYCQLHFWKILLDTDFSSITKLYLAKLYDAMLETVASSIHNRTRPRPPQFARKQHIMTRPVRDGWED